MRTTFFLLALATTPSMAGDWLSLIPTGDLLPVLTEPLAAFEPKQPVKVQYSLFEVQPFRVQYTAWIRVEVTASFFVAWKARVSYEKEGASFITSSPSPYFVCASDAAQAQRIAVDRLPSAGTPSDTEISSPSDIVAEIAKILAGPTPMTPQSGEGWVYRVTTWGFPPDDVVSFLQAELVKEPLVYKGFDKKATESITVKDTGEKCTAPGPADGQRLKMTPQREIVIVQPATVLDSSMVFGL